MPEPEPQFLEVRDEYGTRRIATLIDRRRGDRPGVVWLQGFKSDMVSTKATALAEWCDRHELSMARFDYSGHGRSSGAFEDGTIGAWLAEAEAVVLRLTAGPQVVVGSSMGGHLALLLMRRLRQRAAAEAARVRGLVLIAPAWDMTEMMWRRLEPGARRAILDEGRWLRPSAYADGPYPITRRLIEEGRHHLFAGGTFDPGCPVRILHGMQDPDVPWQHSLGLVDMLAGGDVRLTLVKDGEHRMSRPQDLALLYDSVGEMVGLARAG